MGPPPTMEASDYIDFWFKSPKPLILPKYSTKTVSTALVVSASLILYIHLITVTVSSSLAGATFIEPVRWPIVKLDGHPDNLVIHDRDGTVFLSIDGDIYKYNSDLSFSISTRLAPTTSPSTHPTSQYVNKILKIIKFADPNLLLSCWQTLNLSLRCIFYRLEDVKSVPLVLHVARNVTTIKTDATEDLQIVSSSYDPHNLLFITSRPTSTENQFDLVMDLENNGQSFDAVGLLAMSEFKVMRDQTNKLFTTELTAVLPYRRQLGEQLLFYHYIYFFNYDTYTYFVLNDIRKPKIPAQSNEKETTNRIRLARICRDDTKLTSYTEISITCNNQVDLYAKVAYIDTSKSTLVSNQLYVVAETTNLDQYKKSNSVKSYLCSYSMKLIQDLFGKAITDCHNGLSSMTMLTKLHPKTEHVPLCQKNPSNDWCSSATNPYIDGNSEPYNVKEDSLIQLDGLSATNFFYVASQGSPNPKDVYFIGTESGLITKIVSDEDPLYTVDLFETQVKNYQIGEKLSSIFLNESITSRRGAKYAVGNSHIYAITGRNEIQKLPINGCLFYTTCHSCLTVRDPLQCIWCGDSCSNKHECSEGSQSSSSCPPIIKHFFPQSGPLTGNTRLTIIGESFGSERGYLNVSVANQECSIDRKSSDNNKIECILKAVNKSISSPIKIDVSDDTGYIALKGSTKSQVLFDYRKIIITGNQPSLVTAKSNSEVTIFGENLDVGSERLVLFDDVECHVIKVQETQIKCLLKLDHLQQSEKDGLKKYLKFKVDNIEQEFSKTASLADSNLSNSIEIHENDMTDSATDNGLTQQESGGIFSLNNLFLTFVLLTILTVAIIFLTRYEGISTLRLKIMPKNSGDKSDLEAAKMNFRSPQGNNFMNSNSTGRPSDSLSGLIKLNDLTSDYFSKTDQLDQDKPLMNDLVDDEMISILRQEKILIERNRLTLGHVLGSGQFGRVYKGFLKVENAGEHATVAVKTLHNRCHWEDSDNNQAFLEEGLMMKDFAHENVLALIGVTFDSNGLPMVITPFMLYGDLRSYISDEASSPTVKELIEFGIQVARGMAYLSNLKFVHRDLAARNCMLDENLTVKVADFGLSRDIYERDYYSSDNKKAKLPVKWMAVESLEKSVYSTKTDVWSYGVLLWELMTRGVVPYPDVDNFDLFSYLKEGRRMLRPRYCPVNLYRIMLACWSANPEERPTFDELVTNVSNVITQLQEAKESGSVQQKVSRDETYCDVVT